MKSTRRKPLILRGARQVGKSTLVRQFAAAQKLQLNEINLERHLDLDKVFSTLNIPMIRAELEALVGRSITHSRSLLFLDEIQAVPSAIQALRYFYEDLPELPVISAGSLMEFTLSDHKFSMPVGRIEYHHLGPMTFREFLMALEPTLCNYLDQLDFGNSIPETAHKKLMMRQREFLFVGGMPEAVSTFQETGSFEEADTIHRHIVSTYEDDFAKYASRRELMLLQRVFRLIPRQVGQKVKYVNFSRDHRSRDVKAAIEMLEKARVCLRVFSSHCSGVPLYADINELAFKLLYLDIGLMNHVCGLNWSHLRKMDDIQLVNEGALAEQFIGQHLAYSSEGREPPRLVYWLREGRKTNAEVDYVISLGPEIIPVEVKAGRSGTLRSLHQFAASKKFKRAVRFDTNPPSSQKISIDLANRNHETTFELYSLPLYAVGELERILDTIS
ncbi:ATP-binding protein [bacterium]|nr:ATP-binding protein [candidate division CSSED10-310 bacterium]